MRETGEQGAEEHGAQGPASFSSSDPDINWLISSGKLFDISLPDGLGMRNKKDFTLPDYWADQMYLIYTACL